VGSNTLLTHHMHHSRTIHGKEKPIQIMIGRNKSSERFRHLEQRYFVLVLTIFSFDDIWFWRYLVLVLTIF